MEKTSKPWHAMGIEETLKTLNTREVGLSREEAQKRLAEYGPNELKKEKGISPIRLFLEQFADILILILLIAT
ncbi:MAG: cation-transporting P-type ATPase, partial [Candidatus Bathycorpusculaceae bacterium]